MKKNWLRYLVFFLAILVTSISFAGNSLANEMESLEYRVDLLPDGSGRVTEYRKMNMTRDTELYIVMENLVGSEITDFKVSDFEEALEFQPNWDINASREEKAGRYGIVETSNGLELAWGIGEYGYHEYTVEYTISGMVRQLQDGQGMNWRFDSFGNIPPENMTISILGPSDFTSENTRLWGFGFDGEVYLEDGRLVGWSNSPMTDRNHVTILMQFLDSPFIPTLSLDQTLAEQEDLAKEGSSYGESSGEKSLFDSIIPIVIGFFIAFSIVFSSIGLLLLGKAKREAQPLITGKKRLRMNEDKYYREVPYKEGPITDLAYLMQEVGRGNMEDYFGAFMLKWLNEGRIAHSSEEKGRIFKKEVSSIRLIDSESSPSLSDLESRFWDIITSSAGSDRSLDEKKLSSWAKKNYSSLDSLKTSLNSHSKSHLIRSGYLKEEHVSALGLFSSTVTVGSPAGEELLDHIVQFENYLRDFSLLAEREVKEVVLWEDLLIWASLYGIAEQVSKQLEQFYPQYVEDNNLNYTNIYMIHLFSNSFAKGYQSGLSASSGGGGSTSFGGGGGSFGGGGGGSR